MAANQERRQRVAAMRAGTRQYLAEIRGRRRDGRAAAPAPEQPSPTLTAPPSPVAFTPDPRVAALAPTAEPPKPTPAETASKPVLQDLPLGALRLLGQGMVWRLNNLGVRSLQDLAASDPVRLGESLGPIGRLVRCDVWIAAAREIISQS